MAHDKFMIAPLNSGLQTDMVPWLIADDAYASLNNSYVWRGRVRKRFGSKYMGTASSNLLAPLNSRLRTNFDASNNPMTTTGLGAATLTMAGTHWNIGAMFSIGNLILTVYQASGNMLRSDFSATPCTFNTATGALVIAGAPINTPIYYYPADPVMGLGNFELGPINNHPSYAFDRQFAYVWNGTWERSGTYYFQGSDSQFFWISNFLKGVTGGNYMFVSNFNAPLAAAAATDDDMLYFNGTTWFDFSPLTIYNTNGDFVKTAKIIVPFYGALIFLNVTQQNAAKNTNTFFPNRARWSWQSDPTQTGAWLENNQTTGGVFGAGASYIDAATTEAIISAEFIKNRLIVYFERSTWELVYTGNNLELFKWQKLNTELGSEATFSTVPFDKVVLSIGNVGVHECNGSNVQRIDRQIPDNIFQIQNKREGVTRVAGIRDYYTEMVYWAFPSMTEGANDTFPNRVLVFNYNTGTWAYNDDCITCFGYFEQQTDVTWNSTNLTWADYTGTWTSGIQQSQFRQIIAGNQEGYVYIINADISRNAAVMQLTNLTAAISATPVVATAIIMNHTLHPQDYIQIFDPIATTGLDQQIFQILTTPDANTITFEVPNFTALYYGGGSVARVSQIYIKTKEWNPYRKQNRNVAISSIDFAVKRTDAGQITVDYSPSSTSLSMINESSITSTILGSNILETSPYALYPLEDEQDTLWHRIYFDSDGTSIQLAIYYNDAQMKLPASAFEDFWLEGLILNTMPTSVYLQ